MAHATPPELLIRQRLAALGRTLPVAQGGDVEAIHQARVATRRLREALPLVARGSSGRKLMKRVRRLTRALGAVRELDVALITLDEIEAETDVPTSGIARLREIMGAERQRLCADMVRRIHHDDLEKLQRKTLTVVRRQQSARAHARDPRRLAVARARAARRAVALESAIENAGNIYLPDRLHQVRIAVKKLRYAMEIARDLSGSRAVARIRTLKGAQDLLGHMHDLEVLIMRIRALQGSDNAPDLKLSADLDRLVRRIEMDCRQLHVQYMGLKQKLRDVCDHVVGVASDESGASAA